MEKFCAIEIVRTYILHNNVDTNATYYMNYVSISLWINNKSWWYGAALARWTTFNPRDFSLNTLALKVKKHLPRVHGIETLRMMSRCGGACRFLRIRIDSASFIGATGYTVININTISPSYTGISVLQTTLFVNSL